MTDIRIAGNENQDVQYSWSEIQCIAADPQVPMIRTSVSHQDTVLFEVQDRAGISYLYETPTKNVGDRSQQLLAKTALEYARADGIQAASVELTWT